MWRGKPFQYLPPAFRQYFSLSKAHQNLSACASKKHCAYFLTQRSSRPAFGGRLTSPVSTEENQFISLMLIQTAFNFSSVGQRWVCRFSGLRLVALRWFIVFLASGPCTASASSYFFRSAAPPRWRCAFSQFAPVAKFRLSVLASGSNLPVKPTRILRSAYLARWVLKIPCE